MPLDVRGSAASIRLSNDYSFFDLSEFYDYARRKIIYNIKKDRACVMFFFYYDYDYFFFLHAREYRFSKPISNKITSFKVRCRTSM